MWNLYLLPVTVYPCASLIYCNIYFTLHWWWLQYIVFHIVNYLAWVKSCVRNRLYCILLWIISYIVFMNAEIVELLCRACADEVGSVEFCRQAKHSLWAYFWASHTGHAKRVYGHIFLYDYIFHTYNSNYIYLWILDQKKNHLRPRGCGFAERFKHFFFGQPK